jgi:hypothetical protein
MKIKLFAKRRYIGGESDPLLIRWLIFRIPSFGIMLHKFCRSDYDRALHDHPWTFISFILKGGYYEESDKGGSKVLEWFGPGRVLYRPAEWKHRVILPENGNGLIPSWSLVIIFRRRRKWGFWLGDKWCWWRKYNYDAEICSEDILWKDGDDD